MSNRFQNITDGLAELKNFYQGPLVDQLNEDLPIYRAAEKKKQGWNGYQVVRPIRVRRNQGIGAVSDGGTLPAIGRQGTVQALISAKFNYLRFGITGPMIKASQNDKGSFVRSADYELQMGYKDLASDVNRQLSWDGTGYLAKLSAAAVASSVITVQGREGTTEDGSKFLDVQTVFDIVSASTGSVIASGIEISAITTGTTATLTLSAPVTASSGDYLIRSGSNSQEIQGLLYSLDGGTSSIYGVNRSLYPSFQGNQTTVTGQLTLDQMQKAWNDGLRRGGQANGSYSAIFCDFDSIRYYQKLLTADKRYVNVSSSMPGDGSFGSKGKFYLEFNGVAVVPDKDCPVRMFFLPEGVLEFWELASMEFADETGSMYIAQSAADALECRVRFFGNLFNAQPSACAVLKSYTSP